MMIKAYKAYQADPVEYMHGHHRSVWRHLAYILLNSSIQFVATVGTVIALQWMFNKSVIGEFGFMIYGLYSLHCAKMDLKDLEIRYAYRKAADYISAFRTSMSK